MLIGTEAPNVFFRLASFFPNCWKTINASRTDLRQALEKMLVELRFELTSLPTKLLGLGSDENIKGTITCDTYCIHIILKSSPDPIPPDLLIVKLFLNTKRHILSVLLFSYLNN